MEKENKATRHNQKIVCKVLQLYLQNFIFFVFLQVCLQKYKKEF